MAREKMDAGSMMLACVLVLLCLPAVSVPADAGGLPPDTRPHPQNYLPHPPIRVIGDAGFTAANGVTGGNGTPDDPYIIDGWSVDLRSYMLGAGIYIENTTAPFVVRYVYIYNGSRSPGIHLRNVTNASLTGIVSIGNSCGIYIEGSTGVDVRLSRIHTSRSDDIMSGEGILVERSTRVNISSSVFYDLKLSAVHLNGATYVNITNNTMTGSSVQIDGDSPLHHTTHTITGNTVNGRPLYYFRDVNGLRLPQDAGEIILANVSGFTGDGLTSPAGTDTFLEVAHSSGGLITNGLFTGTRWRAIHVAHSRDVIIHDNVFRDNLQTAVHLTSTLSSTVLNNTFMSNSVNVMLRHGTNDSRVESNVFSGGAFGVGIQGASSRNTVEYNRFRAVWSGVLGLDRADNNTVAYNRFEDVGAGVTLGNRSNGNTIHLNTFLGGGKGVRIFGSVGNTVTSNHMEGQSYAGVLLENGTASNRIHHNTLADQTRFHAVDDTGLNLWSDGYPSGGNHWDIWTSPDTMRGPDQDIPGSDGIVDLPFAIPGWSGNTDPFPLVDPPVVPPYVVSTSPGDGAGDVPPDMDVRILFSRAMERYATEGAIHITPSVNTSTTWEAGGMRAVLHPSAPLTPGTTYTVTVSTDARDTRGVGLRAPYTFSFSVAPPPALLTFFPGDGASGVPRDTDLMFVFDRQMNATSTESALWSAPSIAGTSSWKGEAVLVFHPGADLLPDTVGMDTGAASQDGIPLPRPYRFTFRTAPLPTPPDVLGVSPANGSTDVALNTSITLTFTSPMDGNATLSAVHILPDVAYTAVWSSGGRVLSLNPTDPLLTGTTYTIIVSHGARDVNGTHIQSDRVFTFVTVPTFVPAPPPDMVTVLILVALAAGIGLGIVLTFEWALYALILLFLPLYAKLRRDQVLSHFLRGRIYEFLRQNPGAHLRLVSRELDLKLSTVVYHLKVLESSGLIFSENTVRTKRFYPLSRDRCRKRPRVVPHQSRILNLLERRPGMRFSTLSRCANMSRSKLLYCMDMLCRDGRVIEKRSARGVRYYLPERAERGRHGA